MLKPASVDAFFDPTRMSYWPRASSFAAPHWWLYSVVGAAQALLFLSYLLTGNGVS